MQIFKGTIYGVLDACCFSIIAITQTIAPSGTSILPIVALTLLGGAFVLWVWCLSTGSRLSKDNWFIIPTIISSLGLLGFQIAFAYGIDSVGLVQGSVVSMGLVPVYTYLLTWIIYKRKHTPIEVGILCIACGALIFTSKTDNAVINASMYVFSCIAGFSYILFLFGCHRLLRYHKPEAVITIIFTVSGIALIPILFIESLQWNAFTFFILIDFFIITNVVAMFITVLGLSLSSLEVSATASLAIPFLAILLGIFFIDTSVSLSKIIGLLVLSTSIAILLKSQNHIH